MFFVVFVLIDRHEHDYSGNQQYIGRTFHDYGAHEKQACHQKQIEDDHLHTY